MIIKRTITALCVSAALGGQAIASDQAYTFDWRIYGPDNAMPTQVFSDGQEVRIEFPKGIKPTRVYATDEGGRSPVTIRRASPYYIAETDANRLEITTNKGKITLENPKLSGLMAEARALRDEMAAMRESMKNGGSTGVATWTIREGETLRSAMERWVKEAGWQHLNWTLPYDYPIEASATFTGDLPEAVRQLESAYKAHGGLRDSAISASVPNRVISFEVRSHAQQ